MKKMDPANSLKVFDIKLRSYTAGPSPDNNSRTEVFLLGCKKALQGDGCPGCFNKSTWDINKAEWGYDPVELAADLNENTPNKYITIGGGEPTDQLDNLIILVMYYITLQEVEVIILIHFTHFGLIATFDQCATRRN
jgi:pyruvate-formate lyase-activating enzyme